jgi:GST-like protein
MITLYGMSTPNVQKVLIMLEETGLPYRLRRVDVWKGENYTPEFSALNPVRKVPVLVDEDAPWGKPHTVFESGAVLVYLAEKTGRFLPAAGPARYEAVQWLMVQMAGVGPMFGQYTHFLMHAPDNAYSVSRYRTQAVRFFEALDARLAEQPYLGGEDYSIADMAVFPWTRDRNARWGGEWEESFPHVWDWHARVKARPAVQRMMPISDALFAKDAVSIAEVTTADKDRYLGRGAFAAPS